MNKTGYLFDMGCTVLTKVHHTFMLLNAACSYGASATAQITSL
jgi:hypothetical protein